MKLKSNLAAIAATTMLLSAAAQARPIVGSASIPNFGAVTKETAQKLRPVAAASFKLELYLWLKEEMRIEVDTANSVKHFALENLSKRCLQSAEESSSTRGRVWTLSLTVDDNAVREALEAHNAHFDSLAVAHWDRHKLTMESDTSTGFIAAISALAAATAKITPRSAVEKVGPFQVEDIRAKVQNLSDKMEVKASQTVIEGRPGSLPIKVPTATVSITGTPISGFHVTVFAQNGRQLARLVTNDNGELPLKNQKIPFVHNGSMLSLTPDARTFLQAGEYIKYKDMGVKLVRGQELTFIYKVPTLTYTLEYSVSSQGDAITLPPDFKADAHIRKFLKDSCNIQPAPKGAAADLAVKISAAFTQKTYNDTEEDAMIMTAKAEFKGSGVDKSDKTVFERRYPFGTKLQTGEYVWEATRALRALIRGTLNKE